MKQFCLRGHDTSLCGRDKKYQCIACLKIQNRDRIRKIRERGWANRKLNPIKVKIQDAPCKICGEVSSLCWDHDHATGEFRGWICQRCNRVLGQVNDSPTILWRMVQYLGDAS